MFDFFRIAVYNSGRDKKPTGPQYTDAPDAAGVEPEKQEDLDMLDINLGNKTLVVGVLIALILSYGMVNFDSGSAAKQNGTAIQAALQNVSATDSSMATASTSVETTAADILASPVDGVAVQTDAKPTSMMLQKMEKENRKLERELRHQDRM